MQHREDQRPKAAAYPTQKLLARSGLVAVVVDASFPDELTLVL